MPTLAKLFKRGKYQFIRWPAEFPLNAKEVEIEKSGDTFIVRPRRESQQNLGEWLKHFYATTSPLPDSFLIDRGDSPPQNRN